MEEIVNLLIAISHYLRYGKWPNRHKSFEKELNAAALATGKQKELLCEIANEQLSKLLVKGEGVPTYAYYTRRKANWYKLIVINEAKHFYCRLRDVEITMDIPSPIFTYIK